MSKNPRKNLERRRKESSYSIYMSVGTIIVSIIVIILAINVFVNRNNNKQARVTNINKITNSQNMVNETTSSEVSKSIGKNINEVENTEVNNIEEQTAINTSKQEEEKNNSVNIKNETPKVEEKKEEEGSKRPHFISPVSGKIIKNYSSDNLIYSETLDEWTTHLGIDYAAEKTSIVKAAAEGTIKTIKNDPRYGLTVVIEHTGGFISMYSNLLSTEFIQVGEKITQGQTIATVGNTATFEIADETHLHFEILKDGNNVDPNLYIL